MMKSRWKKIGKKGIVEIIPRARHVYVPESEICLLSNTILAPNPIITHRTHARPPAPSCHHQPCPTVTHHTNNPMRSCYHQQVCHVPLHSLLPVRNRRRRNLPPKLIILDRRTKHRRSAISTQMPRYGDRRIRELVSHGWVVARIPLGRSRRNGCSTHVRCHGRGPKAICAGTEVRGPSTQAVIII
jgi:hypothetical protein